MSLQTEFTILRTYVFPQRGEYENVVGKVDWEVRISDGLAQSLGGGETLLDVDNITSFIPIEQVTNEQLIQWVVSTEGGQAFVSQLEEIHAPMIELKKRQLGLVVWQQ